MKTAENTPQEKSPKKSRKRGEPLPELDKDRFKKIDTAFTGMRLIMTSFPNLSERLTDLFETEVPGPEFVRFLDMSGERTARQEKERLEKEKNPEPPIQMTKQLYMGMCKSCWDYEPQREFAKKMVGTMYGLIIEKLDKELATERAASSKPEEGKEASHV